MQIRYCTVLMIPSVLELAREVEPLFQGPMADDKEFNEFVKRKIVQKEAFVVPDPDNPDSVKGVIAVSKRNNAISWFAVFERYRGQGIGTVLLKRALDDLNGAETVSVITFRPGDEGGLPARKTYLKFGFVDGDDYWFNGLHRIEMKRPPLEQEA